MQVHQILPNFSYGDAIGNDALAIRRLLREWGYPSDIYAQHVHTKLRSEAILYSHYRKVSSRENVLIFHFSIGSEVTSFVTGLPDRKIMVYHNITPDHFFVGINSRVADRCRRGRLELARLAPFIHLALGVSEFNRRELEDLGFRRTGVLPILLDPEGYAAEPSPTVLRRLGSGTTILHVGRIVPNKRIEDLVKTLYFYRRLDPESRLVLVGTDVDMENYASALVQMADHLGLSEQVCFAGQVPVEELVAYYRAASCYLCLSEHEGFCVPILEAMHFDLPVVAYAATGVPSTLGDAGILVHEKDFPVIAELIHRVVHDAGLRKAVIAGQRRRLGAFAREAIGEMLRGYLRLVYT